MYQAPESRLTFIMQHKRSVAIALLGILLVAGGWALYQWSGSRSPITAYRPEDRPALAKIMQDDWYWLVSDGASDYSMDYMFDHKAATLRYPDNSLSIDVYREDGKPVAFVTYHKLDAYRGRVQFLAVNRSARGKGYGKLLMQHALRKLAAQGAYTVELATRIVNMPARKLYKKLGFVETWVDDGFVGFHKNLSDIDTRHDESCPMPDVG